MLRRRLTVLCAGVVGVTAALAALATYAGMRAELRSQVDRALAAQAAGLAAAARERGGVPETLPRAPRGIGGSAAYVQFLDPNGKVAPVPGDQVLRIPLDAAGAGDATRARTRGYADRVIDGEVVRVLTQPLPSGGAVQLGRSLASVDASLGNLRLILAALVAAGTALAAALGRIFARRAISPITALTEAAEHVEATAALDRRIPAPGRDEVGRLGRGFNRMLDRLQAARDAQLQLVADASHELRTPVTSLRTNAEVLRDTDGLDPATRRAIASDVVEQAEELTALMGDLIELARGDVREPEREDVRLDALAAEAVQRARRHAPGLDVRLDARPVVVAGAPDRLARAVNNLLDNAAAHSPPGGAIDVRVTAGELLVHDHGPGIAPDDIEHVFDRFYRGSAARGLHGSGLGLAIVKQVADAHGAVVALEPAPGGGTVARLRFSGAPGSAAAPR